MNHHFLIDQSSFFEITFFKALIKTVCKIQFLNAVSKLIEMNNLVS